MTEQEKKEQEDREKAEKEKAEGSIPAPSAAKKKEPATAEKEPATVTREPKGPKLVPLDPLWPGCGNVPEGESLG